MTVFQRLLQQRQPPGENRRWLFLPYDQLSDAIGPLSREDTGRLGIVLIENTWQLSRRPYHKQKLVYMIANLRHFALEQAARGVAVRYVTADRPYRDVLPSLVSDLGPMRLMEPAERELRVDLQPLIDSGDLALIPHEGWLTTHDQFLAAREKGPPWRMDTFYRHVRRETGILMTRGKPRGGEFSFDPSNREPWRGAPKPPTPPTFPTDAVKDEVAALIETDFAHHPGRLDLDSLPATLDDAAAFWIWAKRSCLRHFGPYQDAMSTHSTGLFHTRLSPLINLHRLLPSRVVADVARASIPLPSKEGFIRQLLGWREYMRHVHLASDGFRRLPAGDPTIAPVPGDAGYARWAGRPWPAPSSAASLDGGAQPCALGGDTPLPPAYWGVPSGLACLDRVVADVWREGWSHHITRLVILASIATLLDVSPRELTDWFWVAYVDAYDWVVEPNVLGMGTFAVGDYLSTKPYITGAAYINRMSDYCERCEFHPRRNCPLTNLYWAFLVRHRNTLGANPRMQMPLASLRKRPPARRREDRRVFQRVRDLLASARPVAPADLPTATPRPQ
jgi:deoxyribodipyrimidine photolyase-related protein